MEFKLTRILENYRIELYRTYLDIDPYTAHYLNTNALVEWSSFLTEEEMKFLRSYETRLFEKGKALW